jgi:hypothetical protein
MKSFVAYPSEFQKVIFESTHQSPSCKLIAHFELFKKVRSLNGSIVKCGINAEEGFTRFINLKTLMTTDSLQQMVAFERFSSPRRTAAIDRNSLNFKISNTAVPINLLKHALTQKGIKEAISFLPGHLDDAIPDFLIENPELKIAYLNIDLDDYEATTTTLEFFYPRLVEGGVLIFDNYYKKEDDYRAVKDYFAVSMVSIHSFNVNNGPHYMFRD